MKSLHPGPAIYNILPVGTVAILISDKNNDNEGNKKHEPAGPKSKIGPYPRKTIAYRDSSSHLHHATAELVIEEGQ